MITCPCGRTFQRTRTGGKPQKWCSKTCLAKRADRSGKSRAWYHANRAYACAREQRRRMNHPDKIRLTELRKRGMNQTLYEELLALQGGRCAICKTTQPSKRREYFDIDHCHQTSALRGLLCERCNRGIGLFQDSPELLESAARYIRAKTQLPFFVLRERPSETN